MRDARIRTAAFGFASRFSACRWAASREVSGLDREVQVEDFREGGVNDYTHKLATVTKYQNLTLKRGLADATELWQWHQDVVNGTIERRQITVVLIDFAGRDTVAMGRREGVSGEVVGWRRSTRRRTRSSSRASSSRTTGSHEDDTRASAGAPATTSGSASVERYRSRRGACPAPRAPLVLRRTVSPAQPDGTARHRRDRRLALSVRASTCIIARVAARVGSTHVLAGAAPAAQRPATPRAARATDRRVADAWLGGAPRDHAAPRSRPNAPRRRAHGLRHRRRLRRRRRTIAPSSTACTGSPTRAAALDSTRAGRLRRPSCAASTPARGPGHSRRGPDPTSERPRADALTRAVLRQRDAGTSRVVRVVDHPTALRAGRSDERPRPAARGPTPRQDLAEPVETGARGARITTATRQSDCSVSTGVIVYADRAAGARSRSTGRSAVRRHARLESPSQASVDGPQR